MAIVDFTQLFLKYRGFWVALSQDETRVVASSKNAKKAYEEAKERGEKTLCFLRSPHALLIM